MAIKCPNCGKPNTYLQEYCWNCGYDLKSSSHSYLSFIFLK